MNEISEKSFNQIKLIEKALEHQNKLDKKNNVDVDMDFLFDDMSVDDSTTKIVTDNSKAISLADLMLDNWDFQTALNLNIVEDDDGVEIYYSDDDLIADNSLNLYTVLSLTKDLLKLGRKGIAEKVAYNKKLIQKIDGLEAKLDNINAK